jgi:hypothetical protein
MAAGLVAAGGGTHTISRCEKKKRDTLQSHDRAEEPHNEQKVPVTQLRVGRL